MEYNPHSPQTVDESASSKPSQGYSLKSKSVFGSATPITEWADDDLVLHAQSVDRAVSIVVDIFYRRYRPSCLRWAFSYLSSEADAWGVTHDAFELLIRRMPRFGAPYRVDGFLRCTVQRKALDRLKRRKRVDLWEPADLDAADTENSARFCIHGIREGEVMVLWREIRRHLRPFDVKVIEMRYFKGLSLKQIATNLGIDEGTMKWQAHQAMKRVREILGL